MGTMNFTPAAENAATNQITATAATSNATATEQREQQTATTRRRRQSDPVWDCATVGRRMFYNLPESLQNLETKRVCFKEAARRTYGDSKRAMYDVKNEARKLLNLLDFNNYCINTMHVDPKTVAQHVVFEGKIVMRRVMEHGVESVLGTKIEMFREPLVVVDTPSAEVVTLTPAESAEQSA